MKQMLDIIEQSYQHGWDERNGGNISYLLTQEELEPYLDITKVVSTFSLSICVKELANKYFLVTGSGKYFRNIKGNPCDGLGIIRIAKNGKQAELIWGFENGALPTSELPSHLLSHISRLSVDKKHRVILHNHASHLLAMTFTHELDERAFTRTLWKMCTECLVVFPEGVSIIPWLVPGTNEIGEATADKMKDTRMVLWPYHGVYVAGNCLDDAFGLVETAEKAAQIYTYVQAQGGIKQAISDQQFKQLAERFSVTPRKGYLD